MNLKKDPTPDPAEPERDKELADAISEHQNLELIEQEAREQACYYMTLANAGVPEEAATQLTSDWTEWMRITSIDQSEDDGGV